MITSKPDLQRLVESGAIVNPTTGIVDVDLVSIGLHLDNQFVEYSGGDGILVTPPVALQTVARRVEPGEHYLLPPGGQALACSQEIVNMPLDTMGFIQTKGTMARGFLMAHMCDGQIDPGYSGKITFELINFSRFTYRLVPGVPIAQLFMMTLSAPVDAGYGGRYQGAVGPTPMRATPDRGSPGKTGSSK